MSESGTLLGKPCPVCGQELKDSQTSKDRSDYECPRCGKYSLLSMARNMLPTAFDKNSLKRAILSHAVHKMHRQAEWPTLSWDQIKTITSEASLPTPAEQADNLIVWLGDRLLTAGHFRNFDVSRLQAVIGTSFEGGVRYVVKTLIGKGLIELKPDEIANDAYVLKEESIFSLTLTFEGWQRLQELKRGGYDTRRAFMAMQFNDSQIEDLFTNYLKPAVAATGFELKKLDDGAPAGLIDDRLRVEIRASRFLIAGLTHHNNGAYWEAGYAEGLGKPVIYLCRNDVFEDKKKGTHFDTNHHLTISWNPDNMSETARKLKDTIRATLPEDANLEDKE